VSFAVPYVVIIFDIRIAALGLHAKWNQWQVYHATARTLAARYAPPVTAR